MTREEIKSGVRVIARILTEEIDRPGTIETRYLSLKNAEREALKLLEYLEGTEG